MASEGEPMDLVQSTILLADSQNRSSNVGSDQDEEIHEDDDDDDEEENEDEVPDVMDTDVEEQHSNQGEGNPVNQASMPSLQHNHPQHDSSSDDEEYYEEPWVEIPRDTSRPSEEELKEIQKRPEPKATDDRIFLDKLVSSFDDPAYSVGETGIIRFHISKFNGTKENPNRELLMKSSIVNIGGYSFQMKVMPRGLRNIDYISVYIECASMEDAVDPLSMDSRLLVRMPPHTTKKPPRTPGVVPIATAPLQPILPFLTPQEIKVRPGVAANIIVVAYNPNEPTVMIQQNANNRFSPKNPDWGWSRFHGPFQELGTRQHCKRAPLLENDEIVFTAYIRIIEDESGCFHEKPNIKNPWDSFMMTGLHPMMTEETYTTVLVAAVSAWMLLKPFRQFLYETPTYKSHECKPMLMAFKHVLLKLRSVVSLPAFQMHWQQHHLPVSLGPIEQALFWHGVNDVVAKTDVIELWEIMRNKLEEELEDTPWVDRLSEIFGASVDRTKRSPAYRIAVKDVGSVQAAISNSVTFLSPDSVVPQVLIVELERQVFHERKKEWQKLRDQVIIDEHIAVNECGFVLYGIISHAGELQSGRFKSVLRPNGPNSAWYQYQDTVDRRPFPYTPLTEKLVQRLTEREALLERQGLSKDSSQEASLPYIALYLNQSVVDGFSKNEPHWDPEWLQYYERDSIAKRARALKSSAVAASQRFYHVHAVNAKAFQDWTQPGFTDISVESMNDYTRSLFVPLDVTLEGLRDRLAEHEDVIDPVQIKVWPFTWSSGQRCRPDLWAPFRKDDKPFGVMHPSHLEETKNVPVSCWYYIHDPSQIKELLVQDGIRKKRNAPPATNPPGSAPSGSGRQDLRAHLLSDLSPDTVLAASIVGLDQPSSSRQNLQEDTIMSDVDEPQPIAWPRLPQPLSLSQALSYPPPPRSLIAPFGQHTPPPLRGNLEDFGSSAAALLSVSRSYLPGISGLPNLSDTWASYQQSQPDRPEIYFFLKTWNPEEQKLLAVGSYFAKSSDRIDHSVFKHLPGMQKRDHSRPIWIERTLSSAQIVKRRKTFEDMKLKPGCIIVIRTEVPKDVDEEDYALEVFKSGWLDLNQYLIAYAKNLAFPDRRHADSSKVYTLSYFGHEFYQGTLIGQEPGGRGTKIYFSGDKYVGQFHLGQRHGFGVMSHINGDTYTGEFCCDERAGQGRCVEHSTGNVYEGGWIKGIPYGRGITHWKKAETQAGLCSVCWDEKRDTVLLNCGHVIGCMTCSKRLVGGPCPVCRKNAAGVLKLWMA